MTGFRRELGLFDSVVVVAGGIIGVGIFANPSNVARVVGDPVLILLVWALGGAVALIGAFVWAELASRFPHVGGQYVYLQRAYPPGRRVSLRHRAAVHHQRRIAGGGVDPVRELRRSLVRAARRRPASASCAALALVGLTAVNAVGVRAGKWTNNLLMAAKVLGMLALVALAFGRGAPPASHFDLAPAVGVRRRVGAPAVHRAGADPLRLRRLAELREHRGGDQGSRRATSRSANVLGVIVVVALYLSMNLAYLWVLTPAQVAASPALAADMARAVAGEAGARFVALLIVVSSLGFLAVVILTGPRLIYAMATDGLFFRARGAPASALPDAGVRAVVSGRRVARAADDEHLRSAALVRRVRRLAVLRADRRRAGHRAARATRAAGTARSRACPGIRGRPACSSPWRPASSSTASSPTRRSR